MGRSTSTDEWWCVWLKPSACDEADIAADCASTCCRAAAVNATLDSLADDLLSVSVALDTAWKLLCGVLVMLMQLGFAMLEAGTVREHNVIATYAKNIIDVILGTLIAALWGYSVAYGGTWPLAWDEDTTAEDHYSFFVFLAFQSTCATLVSGAMAERTAVGSYLVLSCTVSGLLYPLAVQFAYSSRGFLHNLEPSFVDFAGGDTRIAIKQAAPLLHAHDTPMTHGTLMARPLHAHGVVHALGG